MNNYPNGIVTFLFTDIEGSTMLAQKFPDIYPDLLIRHNEILHEAIKSNNGFVFEIIGDAFCAAFGTPLEAINASYNIQQKLISEDWGETPVKIRIGLNTGAAQWNGKGYTGYMTLSRTQRVMSVAHGGQVIISNDVYENIEIENQNVFSFRDLGERRLKSLIKPEHLYQVVAEGLLSDFPPLNTLDARPNNLPVQPTSFIGREKELKEIKALLAKSHLLTLLGTGGTGKTRISLQAGADIIDDFAHGVWFVELASLTEPSLVTQEIASVFGLRESAGQKILEVLLCYLKEKETLIILDNCEHLIDECAKICTRLIQKCPKLKILATSRESLRIDGETLYRVPTLSTPDAKTSAETLLNYEAVQLFIERASLVKTGFNITDINAPAIAQICSQLDGIPLAIELAAARVRSMPVEKIAERLNDRFHLLTGGSRTALPRQQTLQAMIDWSYNLLSETEKILLQRLSVFSGGWKLEAAEEVCGGDGIDKYDVLDLMTSLCDKSLVIFDEEIGRYKMLETVKEFSSEKLNEAKEEEKFKTKHLEYFLRLAEEAEQNYIGPAQLNWFKKLEMEIDNLRAGLRHSLQIKNLTGFGLRLAIALREFWDVNGGYTEGFNWINELMDTSVENDSIRAMALTAKGRLAYRLGNYTETAIMSETALLIFKKLNDKKGISKALNNLGHVAFAQGDYIKSGILYEESLSVYREIGDKRGIANSLNALGNIASYQGDYIKAETMYEKTLAISREIGDKRGIGISLNDLGVIEEQQGNYIKAGMLYEESLAISCELRDKRSIGNSLYNLGIIAYEQSHYVKAGIQFEDSLSIFSEIGDKGGIGNSYSSLGNIAAAMGDYIKAEKLLEEALVIRREIGDKHGIGYSLHSLGTVAYQQADYIKSGLLLKEALVIFQEIGVKLEVPENLENIAKVAQAQQNLIQAVLLFGAAQEMREQLNTPMPPNEKEQYDKVIFDLRSAFGEEAFAKTWAEGRVMTMEEAIELALSTTEIPDKNIRGQGS